MIRLEGPPQFSRMPVDRWHCAPRALTTGRALNPPSHTHPAQELVEVAQRVGVELQALLQAQLELEAAQQKEDEEGEEEEGVEDGGDAMQG